MALTREENETLVKVLDELNRRRLGNKIGFYFPDSGPYRRELYKKHLEFFKAGSTHRQRMMLAANRIGKTESVGLYEVVLHMTGNYPPWWNGRRFNKKVKVWVAGDTKQTVREILQDKLLGPAGAHGTGLIPADKLVRVVKGGGGVADSIEIVYVKSSKGGVSACTFKSYDQGRKAFQGTEQDIILLDEEPPLEVYTECLLRTMTNNGMIMLTFTPLLGMSEVVLAFIPGGKFDAELESDKFVIMATWDDVPHLSDEVKKELWKSIPPFQRDARSKGVPQLGAGAIYPVPESEIVVEPFVIPKHWPRAYALDVGWNRTAALWMAIDQETCTKYLYSEHYKAEAEPSIHATSIRARGDWIPGCIDPAARGRSQKDGEQLIKNYDDLGLILTPAVNAVEAGLYRNWEMLSGGQLKVFSTLTNWLSEYRLYRRDEKGKIVKVNDHLMDCTKYLTGTGVEIATVEMKKNDSNDSNYGAGGWMS